MAEVIEELAIGIEVTPEEAADEVKQLWREVAAERMKRAMHEVIDGSEEAEE
jgi:hypothetical protein